MHIFQSSLSITSLEATEPFAPEIKFNILRSFGLDDSETFRILDEQQHRINMIILDSGVWSKNQNPDKVKHTVYHYRDFLLEHGDNFHCYMNYDEDFKDANKTAYSSKNWDNQEILENAGLKPVPVLHTLENDDVERIYDGGYELVAIGSNALKLKNFKNVVKELYDKNVRVHVFRMGSVKELIGLPAWSCDCSSHAQWGKAGRCVFYDHNGNKESSVSFREYKNNGKTNADFLYFHPTVQSFITFIEDYVGIEIGELKKNATTKLLVNSIYFWWLERFISQHNVSAPHSILFNEDVKSVLEFTNSILD